MEGFSELTVTRYDDGHMEGGAEHAADEYELSLYINDVPITVFSCIMRDLDCLVVGFALTGGLISSADEIRMLSVDTERGAVKVWLKDGRAQMPLPKPPKRPTDVSAVLARMEEFAARSDGTAVYGAALCTQRELLLYHEDLDRHNAADKAIGDAALQGADMAGMMLLTNGSPSSAMVRKAEACRLSLIASTAAPTVQAVQAARAVGAALIGGVNGRKCTIYCG